MTDDMLTWAKDQSAVWTRSLKALRSGVLGTTEVRYGKRVNTTLETIAERKRELAELDAMIEKNSEEWRRPASQAVVVDYRSASRQ